MTCKHEATDDEQSCVPNFRKRYPRQCADIFELEFIVIPFFESSPRERIAKKSKDVSCSYFKEADTKFLLFCCCFGVNFKFSYISVFYIFTKIKQGKNMPIIIT